MAARFVSSFESPPGPWWAPSFLASAQSLLIVLIITGPFSLKNAADGAAEVVVENFMHGGERVMNMIYPWETAVLQKLNGTWKPVCGGALIEATGRFVVTSASCFDPESASKVVAGTHTSDKGGETIDVRRAFIHDGFSNATRTNNVAVLQLRKPLALSEHIKVIPMADGNRALNGKDCVLPGWGEVTVESWNGLYKIEMSIISRQHCRAAWHNEYVPGSLCASIKPRGDSKPCEVAAAGPLVCYYKNSPYPPKFRRRRHHARDKTQDFDPYAVGLVNFAMATCSEANRPIVFTRLSHYLPWIYRVINNATHLP